MIWLDNREAELIKLLGSTEGLSVKQLQVADIWIGVTEDKMSEGGLVIERKSIKDLEASILDGRYREQRRLQKKAIMKFINRLIFHYQIPVAQTQSVQETAELIQALLEQWKDDPNSLKRTTELVKVTDGIHIQKKANAADYKQFGISCLAQCPGVSVKMAEALIETFGSLKGVIDAPVKDIENVKVGTRKVGPVVSKRLSEILNMN
jgi:ERCC4-type nuclease